MKAVKTFMIVITIVNALGIIQLLMQRPDVPLWILLIAFLLASLFWLAVALLVRWIVIQVQKSRISVKASSLPTQISSSQIPNEADTAKSGSFSKDLHSDNVSEVQSRDLSSKYIAAGILNHTGAFASGEWGAKFISSIHDEIEAMKTMKSPVPVQPWGAWTPDDHEWFVPCIDILDKGAESGAAEMLYLAAELKTFSSPRYILDMEEFDLERKLWISGKDAAELYLESAEKGFPHAMLWCLYCMSKGVHGFEHNTEMATQFLNDLKETDHMPRTIGLDDLRFLKDDVKEIVNQAGDADYMEDEVYDRYIDLEYEELKKLLPDPEWRTLHLRTVDLSVFSVSLGLPYILDYQGYDYQWDDSFFEPADKIKTVKTQWLDWCLDQGLLITMD